MVREPGKEITTDADLSEREKESLYDLLERWTSAYDFIPLPILADKKKEQMSVPVGKFNDHLPITPMKRKKGQAE
ncbi:hypothetical protein B0J15DRAFT_546864 [Fusarium solani]|uniref:Uncharacterized protein n=1 Tax=Fusarium solani TaxID=169388 RepID=A0A9P9HVT6_FUSSL|nr:uncharacterized protein B0J15DRAFT_546864 [Fusarium solani]KAH7264098.1 hypothetical protein B0J15DRAFT_546864 [Fusarium solani]